MKVSQLFVYPVKSLRGIAINKAELTPLGLRYDRHWMIIDDNDMFATMRKHPEMILIKTQINADNLVLSTEEMLDLEVPLFSKNTSTTTIKATIWRDECVVVDEGTEAAEWLTQALQSKKPLRLVRMANNERRPQSKPDRFGDATTQFADACAYLLCNQASLDKLNQNLLEQQFEPVTIERFRPNIVLKGESLPAFSEHQQGGRTLHHANYQLLSCDPCQRCIVPNVDIETGIKDPKQQPYKSLVKLNPMPTPPKAAAFGQNMLLAQGNGATIQVGDELTIN